jgi:hypothetical protein
MSAESSPRACLAAVRGKRTARIVAGRKNATRAKAEAAAYDPASSEKRALTTSRSTFVRTAMPMRPTTTGQR